MRNALRERPTALYLITALETLRYAAIGIATWIALGVLLLAGSGRDPLARASRRARRTSR